MRPIDDDFADYVRARQHRLLRAAYLVCGDALELLVPGRGRSGGRPHPRYETLVWCLTPRACRRVPRPSYAT